MKKIAIAALKGGTGKSTVCAYLGLALIDMGYKVGLIDIDVTGSTIHSALGVPPPPWGLDTAREKIVVPQVNSNCWLLSIASHVGEDFAVIWGNTQHKELTLAREKLGRLKDELTAHIDLKKEGERKDLVETLGNLRRAIDDIISQSKWHFVSELLSEDIVTWPVVVDFMIADLPPSCVTGDTQVYTPQGPIDIANLQPGDKVFSFEGTIGRDGGEQKPKWHFSSAVSIRSVQRIIPNGYDDVYELRTPGRQIHCNARHPFLVIDKRVIAVQADGKKIHSYSLAWKRLSDLRVGEFIIISKKFPSGCCEMPPKNLPRLVGYFLGDGNVHRDKRWKQEYPDRVIFSEPRGGKYRNKYLNIAKDIFSANAYEYDNGFDICSAKMARAFVDLGLEKIALTKTIPQWAFELPNQEKIELIEGFCDADGHRRRRGNMALTTASLDLIKGLHSLSIYSGLRTSNIMKRHSVSSIRSRRLEGDGYSIEIMSPTGPHPSASKGTGIVRFNNGHGITSEYFGIERITSIKYAGVRQVYDLQLDRDSNFIANGIPVHNTSEEMLSFLNQVKDLFGVIIVSQPTQISTIGLQRTIDLLRVRQIPIIGLVSNQDGFLNRHGEIEYQFLSPRVDLEAVAQKSGVPFLISIPQTGDHKRIKPYFSELAKKVLEAKPVILKEVTLTRRLKRKILQGIARKLTSTADEHSS